MNKIELLAPAGNLEKIKYAFLYGADAVYFGGQNYSLRANAKNLNIEEIKAACDYAHKLGKKVYVTVNIIFHNEDVEGLYEYLKELEKCKVDAIMVSEGFIVDLINNRNINLKPYISTQTSLANYEAINYWKDKGVERVVLARETSKEEIKEIIEKTGMEIECFLHGAMCSSYSGRCVLSNYFTNRDANRGGCSQICRFDFDLYTKDKQLVEAKTKFTMSCKDLSLINELKEMIEIGIISLKVEGRMRSNYYIATVINTYRRAIDEIYSNTLTEDKIKYYNNILSRVANRESCEQFFKTFPKVNGQYFLGRNEVSNQDFLGIVDKYDDNTKEVTLLQRNYFKKGDRVEIFGPNIEPFEFIIPDIYDEKGNLLEVANHPEQIIKFKLDKKVYQFDIMRIKIY